MKELKKRIKGLSAILLAVCLALCLVIEMSGVKVSAGTIKTGNGSENHTPLEKCVGLTFSAVGDGLEYGSSGGYFAIEYETGNSDNMEKYLTFGNERTANDDETKYYGSVKVTSNNFPTQYKSIKITAYEPVTKLNEDGTEAVDVLDADNYRLYKLTFAWVPNTTISIGQTVSLTTGTQYSFSGTGTYKVQGDPTVYHATDFYVSQDGTYTIEQ